VLFKRGALSKQALGNRKCPSKEPLLEEFPNIPVNIHSFNKPLSILSFSLDSLFIGFLGPFHIETGDKFEVSNSLLR
jgi:hypothetical protein